ncbi:MAG: hypothetical protein R3309_00405 [Reinekea sp.]|jgi:hypothetical protein|nr:hypothetical protein [Reinekea sp.]MDX1472594.1 hypothetical protein [Reinekea sp.]
MVTIDDVVAYLTCKKEYLPGGAEPFIENLIEKGQDAETIAKAVAQRFPELDFFPKYDRNSLLH